MHVRQIYKRMHHKTWGEGTKQGSGISACDIHMCTIPVHAVGWLALVHFTLSSPPFHSLRICLCCTVHCKHRQLLVLVERWIYQWKCVQWYVSTVCLYTKMSSSSTITNTNTNTCHYLKCKFNYYKSNTHRYTHTYIEHQWQIHTGMWAKYACTCI